MPVKADIRFRVYVVYIMFFVFATLIMGRVLYLQYFKGGELKELSKQRYMDREELEPIRGNIYSNDGSLLSTTLPVFNLYWDALVCKDDTFRVYHKELAAGLAEILGDRSAATYDALLKEARTKKRRYQIIKSQVPFSKYLEIKKLPIFRLSKNRGGLCIDIKNKRVNPFGLLANRSIGRYSKNKSSVGLELFYNDYLQGQQGSRLVKLVAGGTKMPLDGSEIDPENGQDLHTSLDVNLQEVAENSLMDVVRSSRADFGTCIVMEAATGRVKALANLGKQRDGSYWEDYNYALLKQYPGSTFKLISLMSLLEDSIVDLDDYVHVGNGTMKTNSGVIRDVHFGASDIKVREAFAESSNTAFARMIYSNYRNQPNKFINFLYRIGLDENSGVDLVGEPKPFIRGTDNDRWTSFSLAYMAHGYEMLITPMKMCQIYNAVANDGVMMKPQITVRIDDYGRLVENYEPVEISQICSKRTATLLKEAMAEVVNVGTGKALQNPYYKVGGKTGTAKWVDNKTKFKDNVYTASFIGCFPLDAPEYTICVSVKLPKNSSAYSGSSIALPVFKAVADRIYARDVCKRQMQNNWYNTPADYVQKVIASDSDKKAIAKTLKNKKIKIQTLQTEKIHRGKNEYKIPDVEGLTLKDALYVLENIGFKTSFKGTGKIAKQTPSPNSSGYYGQKIYLELN